MENPERFARFVLKDYVCGVSFRCGAIIHGMFLKKPWYFDIIKYKLFVEICKYCDVKTIIRLRMYNRNPQYRSG